MAPFTFATTPLILFGAGKAAEIGTLAAARLGARVLVVTDRGLVGLGLVAPVIRSLEAAGVAVAVFDAVEADPKEGTVLSCAEAAKAHGATGVIGFGGGSSMDVAKVAALLAVGLEDLSAIYGIGFVRGPRLALMLVPTTAGTGSEVTPISIITTGETEKKGVVSSVLLPDIALLDPDLTLGLPAPVTAATGVDAMVHAIEAYTSGSANNNPVSRTLALEALRCLGAHIRMAVSDGQNREARAGMLLGSMLAGQAFANAPVAAVHALAYPVGGIFHIPHGLSNALVLPEVLRFNAGHAPGYADLAPALFPETEALAPAGRIEAFVEGLVRLCAELGLPARLRDVGIPEASLDRLAGDAMKQTRLLVNNPRPVTLEDARAIYGAAW